MTVANSLIPGAPAQGAHDLKFFTIILEAEEADDLQMDVNAELTALSAASLQGGSPFLVDVQYQITGKKNKDVTYSAMILIGQWNPTP